MGREVGSTIAAGKGPPDIWDARKPWIAACHALVSDTGFWEDQVRSAASAWVASGGGGSPKACEESFVALRCTKPREEEVHPQDA